MNKHFLDDAFEVEHPNTGAALSPPRVLVPSRDIVFFQETNVLLRKHFVCRSRCKKLDGSNAVLFSKPRKLSKHSWCGRSVPS